MPAPDFALPDTDGSIVRLSDRRGGWVVLYFFRGTW
jgi:peroxiredoxin